MTSQHRYASRTSVPVERSRAEVEGLLRRYGADQFLHGWEEGRAVIGFRIRGYPVRMLLPLPRVEEFLEYRQPSGRKAVRGEAAAARACEQAERQAWRALVLVLKAKLEAVESGITTIEQEFLSGMVLPQDITVGEALMPHLEEAVRTGRMPGLLPGGGAIPLPPAGG